MPSRTKAIAMQQKRAPKPMTGGQEIVASLLAHGVDRVFCVPGESFLGIIDALVDAPQIQLVTARHEGGAGFMAVADARLTGRPGVVMVSRGPGASNATIAIQTAHEDGVPLVVIVGQVERQDLGRGAFQEVNYAKTYSELAKWTVQIDAPERAAALMAQAFHVARRGLPGPVVVSIPEDVLDATCVETLAPVFSVARPRAAQEDAETVAAILAASSRPLLIAGMAVNTQRGRAALRRVADTWELPVAASARQPDILTNDHPSFTAHLGYAADPRLVNGLREASTILGVGTRLGDVTSQGYSFPAAPQPAHSLIHVHESADAVGTLRETNLALLADCAEFLDRLAALAPESRPWVAWRNTLHETYVQWSMWTPVSSNDGTVFGAMVEACSRHLPDDAIITADAGNFGIWLNRYFRYRGEQRFLNALSGAMGFGVPAAVAASLRYPSRRTVCFVGDGGFLMTGAELATARAAGANPVIVVSDNGSYGTIRMHQEKRQPRRVHGTSLINPDFAAIARAHGCHAIQVRRNEETDSAIVDALAHNGPVLIHVVTSLSHISPTLTLDARDKQRPGVHA